MDYVRAGIIGSVLGGLVAGSTVLSWYLGAYQTGSGFVLRVLKDVSEIFLIPAFFVMGWGTPITVFILGVILVYFLLGAIILGPYYKNKRLGLPLGLNKPMISLSLVLIIIIFGVYRSWIDWEKHKLYMECENKFPMPSGLRVNCSNMVGDRSCNESELEAYRQNEMSEKMRIQCLKDAGIL